MIQLDRAFIQESLMCGEALVFDEINSTNEYLLNHCHRLENGSLCLAESQTAGRGRRGRQWYSPQGQNLYFSMLWKYPLPQTDQLSSLSLVVAVIIAETFEELGVADIQIKWPNDIYYQDKKAGGILIESKLDRSGISLVIGIGLNLAMNTIDPNIINQPWADLAQFHFDRNQLAAKLATKLQQGLQTYPETGFAEYSQRWQKFDCFFQKAVKLVTETAEIHGISLGINQKGELLLEREGNIDAFAIGEISLRADQKNG